MLKLLIADDEINVRESLELLVKMYCPDIEIVAMTDSVSATVKAIQFHKPHIVLLDIEMKEGTGFDVLKNFSAPTFKVVFITAHQEFALKAFRFSALDYLLKPVDPDELVEAITKAVGIIEKEKISMKIDSFFENMEQMSKGMKKIVIRTAEDIHVVQLQDIMYCEADRSYTIFNLKDNKRILVSTTLGEYEEMLQEYNFLRIHQSYLVNINFIKRYEKSDGGKVVLTNDVKIPVATRKKDHLLQLLNKL